MARIITHLVIRFCLLQLFIFILIIHPIILSSFGISQQHWPSSMGSCFSHVLCLSRALVSRPSGSTSHDHRGLVGLAVSGSFTACLNIRACSSLCDGMAVTENDGNPLHALGSRTRRKKLWAQNLRCQCGRDGRQTIVDLDHPASRNVWTSTFCVNRDTSERDKNLGRRRAINLLNFHQKFRKSKE